jgi:hypothetical protein
MRRLFPGLLGAALVVLFLVSGAISARAWSVVSTPNRGTLSNTLNGVAAVSDTLAFAVGHSYQTDIAAYRTLVEHWDGRAWRIVASPNVGTGYNELYAVAAAAPDAAWAVGYARPDGYSDYRPLILRWDGARWSTSSISSSRAGQLLGVTAITRDDVWAVGSTSDNAGRAVPLALHWDGTRWSSVAMPAPAGARYALLAGVSGVASHDVWAVGQAYVDRRYVTMAARWDGIRWTLVPSPNLGTKHNRLHGVAAAGGEAWAVGDAQGAGSILLHWDGGQWSEADHPAVSGGFNTLWGVAARGPDDVWTAGYYQDAGGGIGTMVQRWDGARWSRVDTPSVGASAPLFAIDAADHTVWSVGLANDGAADRNLAVKAAVP